jgi:hypothetical protein
MLVQRSGQKSYQAPCRCRLSRVYITTYYKDGMYKFYKEKTDFLASVVPHTTQVGCLPEQKVKKLLFH